MNLPKLLIDKKPPVKLSRAQLIWWDWAFEGLEDVLEDESFITDNPDMFSEAGQREDMRYRLNEQAYAVADTDASELQLAQRHRCLNNLNKKLEDWYNK